MKRLGWFCLWMNIGLTAFGQSRGGGIWLEANSSCVGSVIMRNQALDGFGVAGGDAVLMNCTVIENSIYMDTVYYPRPGDIYCADGQIVDLETYRNKKIKNAIGVVFWINGDPYADYPKGAVVALTQSSAKMSWGAWSYSDWDAEENWLNEPHADPAWPHLDTCCYQNTLWLVNRREDGHTVYEAGPYCWDYRAYWQENDPLDETKNIRWCMPTLLYLKRMMIVKSWIHQALAVIRDCNSELMPESFYNGDTDLYWSCDDAAAADYMAQFVWCIKFKTDQFILQDNADPSLTLKTSKNWVRPIFIY